MIKHNIHENGWIIELDFNLKNIDNDSAAEISNLLKEYPLVVAKNQLLNVEDELKIIKFFDLSRELSIYNMVNFKNIVVPDSDGYLIRVTGAKNKDGPLGMFAKNEGTPWHCDNPYPHPQRALTYLYAVQGSKNSITAWANSQLAFNDLDNELKQKLKKAYMKNHRYSPSGHETEEYMPVYDESRGSYVLIPFFQIDHFKDMSEIESKEIVEFLNEFFIRDKYVYSHNWNDGDLIFSNERLSNHKRFPFDKMEERILHKACFGFIK